MTVTDDLVAYNRRHSQRLAKGSLHAPPVKGVAIVACIDARLDPPRGLGREEGDADPRSRSKPFAISTGEKRRRGSILP